MGRLVPEPVRGQTMGKGRDYKGMFPREFAKNPVDEGAGPMLERGYVLARGKGVPKKNICPGENAFRQLDERGDNR